MTDWRGDDPWRLRSDEYGNYWLNTRTGEIERPKVAYVRGDLPEYISPVTGKPVDGRAARREDLKRSGCIELDPPKKKRGFTNPEFCKRNKLPFDAEAAASRKKAKRISPLETL